MRIALILILSIFWPLGCDFSYIAKQGYYQAKLLCGAKPIKRVLRQENLSELQKDRLLLILDVREYGKNHVGLDIGKNYTKVNLKWDNYVWVVSASPELEFRPYLWSFPIAGQVPYKGHFERTDAEAERDRLIGEGYDVQMRPIDAYSSVGYFNDPVWAKTLERSTRSIVDLILHELSHRTVYFVNQGDFNESFANFVGKNAALQYFEDKFGRDSQEYLEAAGYYEDERSYRAWMWQLYLQLEKVYGSDLPDEKKRQQKKMIFEKAPDSYAKVAFKTQVFRQNRPANLNNASLMSFRQYNSNQDDFASLLKHCGDDWASMMKLLRSLKGDKTPRETLQKWSQNKEWPACEASGS